MILLTPMMLASTPAVLEHLDATYDHRSQTQTYKDNAKAKVLKVTLCVTFKAPSQNGGHASDYEQDG